MEAGLKDVDEVRRHPRRLACLTPPAAGASAALKDFLRRHVYFRGALLEERPRVSPMLAELFQFFLEHPDRLPPPYGEQAAASGAAPGGLRLHRGHDRRLLPPHLPADRGE